MASSANGFVGRRNAPAAGGRDVELSVAQERTDLVAQVEHDARCRFGPIPFTLLSIAVCSLWITSANSAGVKAESTMRAVCPPMPFTEVSASKRVRSCFDEKP